MWNKLFALGSLMASMAQGRMLGAYITGLSGDAISVAFSIYPLTLPALYIMLGGAWLLIKTEDEPLIKPRTGVGWHCRPWRLRSIGVDCDPAGE